MKKLSWKPIRSGARYCSAACGRGCTFKEYESAKRDAEHLLKRLKGKGWKTQVWENLGWHYSADRDYMTVHSSSDKKFHCLISDTPNGGGGLSLWTTSKRWSDPNKAVKDAIASVRRVVTHFDKVLEEISRTQGEPKR